MVLPISGLAEMAANLPGNYATGNTALAAGENMGHAIFEMDVSAGGTITLTQTELNSGYVIKLTGSPGGAFNLDLPDGDRSTVIWNEAGQTATIDTVTGSTATPTVADNAAKWFQLDSDEIVLESTVTVL